MVRNVAQGGAASQAVMGSTGCAPLGITAKAMAVRKDADTTTNALKECCKQKQSITKNKAQSVFLLQAQSAAAFSAKQDAWNRSTVRLEITVAVRETAWQGAWHHLIVIWGPSVKGMEMHLVLAGVLKVVQSLMTVVRRANTAWMEVVLRDVSLISIALMGITATRVLARKVMRQKNLTISLNLCFSAT